MILLIDSNDLDKLSNKTKGELANLLGFELKNTPSLALDDDDEIEDLTFKYVKKFMSGVSDSTKIKLKVFAEMEKTTIKEIENKTGEKFKWAGFQSGVTRRLRTITGDPEAELIGWNEEDWNENSQVWVSTITRDSLRRYFKLD